MDVQHMRYVATFCEVSANIPSFKIKQFIYILYFVRFLANTLEYPRVLCEVH